MADGRIEGVLEKRPVEVIDPLPAGDNNIGDVEVVSQPARDRLTDNMGVAQQTDKLMNDTTALTPKFAKISASASGDNSIVPLVSGKKIRVLAYNFIANGDVNAKWRSGTTDITGLKYCTQYTGMVAPFNPVGWCETVSGQALNLNLSGAIAVGGEITYVEV